MIWVELFFSNVTVRFRICRIACNTWSNHPCPSLSKEGSFLTYLFICLAFNILHGLM